MSRAFPLQENEAAPMLRLLSTDTEVQLLVPPLMGPLAIRGSPWDQLHGKRVGVLPGWQRALYAVQPTGRLQHFILLAAYP